VGGLTQAVAVGAGAGLAEVAARAARRLPAERQVAFYASGLAIAAAIYPAARRRSWGDRRSVGELVALVGYGTASVLAARRPRALAAAWASHALFDAVHGHDENSRLPSWYPAVCAGYDLVLCGHLARAA